MCVMIATESFSCALFARGVTCNFLTPVLVVPPPRPSPSFTSLPRAQVRKKRNFAAASDERQSAAVAKERTHVRSQHDTYVGMCVPFVVIWPLLYMVTAMGSLMVC